MANDGPAMRLAGFRSIVSAFQPTLSCLRPYCNCILTITRLGGRLYIISRLPGLVYDRWGMTKTYGNKTTHRRSYQRLSIRRPGMIRPRIVEIDDRKFKYTDVSLSRRAQVDTLVSPSRTSSRRLSTTSALCTRSISIETHLVLGRHKYVRSSHSV